MPGHISRIPRTVKVLVIGIAVLLLGVGVTFKVKEEARVARLANGDVITLEDYAFRTGSVPYDLPNRPLARALMKVLPATAQKAAPWLRPESTIYAIAPFRNEPLLSAAFSVRDASGRPKRAGTRMVVSDERGQTFDSVLNFMAANGVFEAMAFPRRGRELRLSLMNDDLMVAEFKIPNPCPGPHPIWKPQQLPIAVTNGTLEVSMEKFVADVAHESTWCMFRVREHGQDSTAYMPGNFEIFDAAGNHWRPAVHHPLRETNGCVTGTFLGALWAGEEAWKVRVEFKAADENVKSRSPRVVEFLAKPEQVWAE